jgi:GrpB-like predicted nucleotidyltransferase (UPF0157 family)
MRDSSDPEGSEHVDLGLARGSVRLHAPSLEWPLAFAREIERLRAAVGEHVSMIEHVGSTSIPGMPAKPIVDMMAAVATLNSARALIPRLEVLDYEFRPDAPPPDRVFFAKGPRHRRTHHLSLAEPTSDYWARTLLFRDYLRTHPEAAQQYRSLKEDLARAHAEDRGSYTAGKAAFVESVLALARSAP